MMKKKRKERGGMPEGAEESGKGRQRKAGPTSLTEER